MKLISGVASLLAGAVIYLLFRSKNLLGFELLNRIGVESWADRIRSYTADVRLPDVFVNSLPGGLWALGYILVIDSIFGNQSRFMRIVWASVIPLRGASPTTERKVCAVCDANSAIKVLLPMRLRPRQVIRTP